MTFNISWKFSWDQFSQDWLKSSPKIFHGAFAPTFEWCRRPCGHETPREMARDIFLLQSPHPRWRHTHAGEAFGYSIARKFDWCSTVVCAWLLDCVNFSAKRRRCLPTNTTIIPATCNVSEWSWYVNGRPLHFDMRYIGWWRRWKQRWAFNSSQ